MENEEINDTINNPAQQNQDNYDDLLVSIEAGQGQLNLLIAVADDPALRQKIIDEYEAELPPTIRAYRVELAREEPSLRAAVASVVETDEYLRQGGAAVVTVTGAEKLLFLKFGDGSEDTKSQQEKFFGYLQWTREALRQFPFSIVLWVTAQLEKELAKKSPDFWSWRKGVFRFQSTTKAAISSRELSEMLPFIETRLFSESDDPEDFLLPLADLQHLITQTEQQRGLKYPSLSSLYASMGKLYKNRLERGECQDYLQEQALAIEYFQKAIDLQKKLGDRAGMAISWVQLGDIQRNRGNWDEAEKLYRQSLEIETELGDRARMASSWASLGNIERFRGNWDEAEKLYRQSLEIETELGDLAGMASSWGVLGDIQRNRGHWDEAEKLYRQSLDLRTELGDLAGMASSWGVLGDIQRNRGNWDEAEKLYRESLYLRTELGQELELADSLNNLAGLYESQGRYESAELLLVQALEMRKRILGVNHPDVASSLNNLANLYYSQGRYEEAEPLYLQALKMKKRILGVNHPDVASSLNNLASLYSSQGRYEQAEPLYVQTLEIFKRILGENHPHTIAVQKNLDRFRDEMQAKMNQD
ncbi:hypothetical protein AM228_21485 [Planktothricoides sp. SR001]|uniref:tetratricopeptide repeat protein n=1 Tax=Planktothricoides sp. SR001 TaxID=1705388 RepID=UPI0006C44201|nr:tetratricopeptide repeat protein [Planktothricoides sp. SR001]KOR34907.1 hypothetical protein AM228_21485 [Planktothricoides sp. SR001]